jgi:hypothetical protein
MKLLIISSLVALFTSCSEKEGVTKHTYNIWDLHAVLQLIPPINFIEMPKLVPSNPNNLNLGEIENVDLISIAKNTKASNPDLYINSLEHEYYGYGHNLYFTIVVKYSQLFKGALDANAKGSNIIAKLIFAKEKYLEEFFKKFLANYTIYAITGDSTKSPVTYIKYAPAINKEDLVGLISQQAASDTSSLNKIINSNYLQVCFPLERKAISNTAFPLTSNGYFTISRFEEDTVVLKISFVFDQDIKNGAKQIGLVVVNRNGEIVGSQKAWLKDLEPGSYGDF